MVYIRLKLEWHYIKKLMERKNVFGDDNHLTPNG